MKYATKKAAKAPAKPAAAKPAAAAPAAAEAFPQHRRRAARAARVPAHLGRRRRGGRADPRRVVEVA